MSFGKGEQSEKRAQYITVEIKAGKELRIMHNSVIKYVTVPRIERYPSKRAARKEESRFIGQ